MSNQTLNLFPMSVMIPNKKYEMTDNEKKFINNLDKEGNYGGGQNEKSVSSYILENEELKKFKDFLQINVNDYMHNHMQYSDDLKFYITQSWVNYNVKDTSHHKHNHPNSIVSGVYYVQGSAPIEFHRDNTIFPLEFPCKNFVIQNSTSWWFDIQPQDLILFPSKLSHSVKKNQKEETRISIAFNTFVKGKMGSEKNLTELDIKDEYKDFDYFHI